MFTVRYAMVDPNQIINRIVFNPNYGGKACTVPGTCIVPITERQMKPEFFVAMTASISQTGYRNPITLYNTPEGLLLSFGGSRLRVAKQLDIDIPAIVVDYTGGFEDEEEVTMDNYVDFYTDVPVYFEWTNYGIETHYSLERMRREHYDPQGMEWTKDLEDTTFLAKEFPWLSE